VKGAFGGGRDADGNQRRKQKRCVHVCAQSGLITVLEHLQCMSKPNHGRSMIRSVHWSNRTLGNLSSVQRLQMVRTMLNKKMKEPVVAIHGVLSQYFALPKADVFSFF